MKINKVEELVGITKKNIRFYEDKGLLSPQRNAENGYREYSDEDVESLRKIKLLRQLSVPIEEISNLQKGILTLEDCMKRHIIYLEREEHNLNQSKSVCTTLMESGAQLDTLDTDSYLLLMEQMEKEGVRFMNITHTDKNRKAPIIAALVMILVMVAVIGLILWANTVDPIPTAIVIIIIAFPAASIIGILLALKDRMKQIEGGEEYEARKY